MSVLHFLCTSAQPLYSSYAVKRLSFFHSAVTHNHASKPHNCEEKSMASQADKVRAKFEAVFAEADPEVVPSIARQIEAEIAAPHGYPIHLQGTLSLLQPLQECPASQLLSGDMDIIGQRVTE